MKLYTTGCPRCNVLEKKLVQANIEFEKIQDFDPDFLLEKGFSTAPVLNIGSEYLDYTQAVKWIKTQE